MKYFQFHLGDWATSTNLLNATEKGVYLDLLCLYYSRCKCICKDDAHRIASAYAPNEKKALDYILRTFFTERNGCYYNARCEKEIAGISAISEKRKNAANARWQRENQNSDRAETDANAYANAMHECNANAMPSINHNPITINQERVCVEPSPSAQAGTTPPPTKAPAGIPADVWADWMTVREFKPVTKTFWTDFCAQAKKLGMDPAKAVELCASNGWKRLDASWESVQKVEDETERVMRLMGVAK